MDILFNFVIITSSMLFASKRITGALLATLIAVPLLVVAATNNSDQEYRNCEREAMNRRENRIIEVTHLFQDRVNPTIEERRQRYFDAWGIEEDRDRGNVLRDIDRDIRNRIRDFDRLYREDVRNAQNDFRNDDRDCKNAFNQRQKDRRNVPVGKSCSSSDECAPPMGICSTEFGDCRRECPPDIICTAVCKGVCVIR